MSSSDRVRELLNVDHSENIEDHKLRHPVVCSQCVRQQAILRIVSEQEAVIDLLKKEANILTVIDLRIKLSRQEDLLRRAAEEFEFWIKFAEWDEHPAIRKWLADYNALVKRGGEKYKRDLPYSDKEAL